MPSKKINPSLLLNWKYPSLVVFAGGLVAWDQIRRVKRKIELSTCPKVWTRPALAPEFIYISDAKAEDLLQKFEIGGLTNELYKMIQLWLWVTGKLKGSQLYEDLFSFHQNLAWRFLRLAQDDHYFYRQRAVHTLARMPSLSDATCTEIAQACDMRTAVGISRTEGGNLRLLLDPPGWRRPLDRVELLRRLHTFLLQLDKDCPHPCLQYVIADAFAETDHKGFDDDVGFNKSRPEVIPKCVEAILHHSWLGSNARSIVTHGGLGLLVDLYRVVEADEEKLSCLIMISRILSNISMLPDVHSLLHISGCVKVLAQMLRHGDVRVSVPAGRALLNCDTDASPSPQEKQVRLLRNVYVLHPLYRSLRVTPPAADVVFVHGLLGGVFVTWRQRDKPDPSRVTSVEEGNQEDLPDLPVDSSMDTSQLTSELRPVGGRDCEKQRTQCWPRDWLPRDCPDVRVLGVNYDTNISQWAPMCPIAPNRLTLTDRSLHLTEALKAAGVGQGGRPVIWVAHSMGGLIVKSLLVKCAQSQDEGELALLRSTRGVVFFSTPHRGSRLASMNPTSRILVWPTIEVQELRQNSAELLSLHDQFLSLCASHPIRVISFAERRPTFVRALNLELRFVEDESSWTEVGEFFGVPLDHLSVCKPAVRESFLYQKVLHLIEETISKTKRENRKR